MARKVGPRDVTVSAMESSAALLFRALVMLACLIIVPLAAIFGSAFPEVVKSVLVDRLIPPGGSAPASQTAGGPPPATHWPAGADDAPRWPAHSGAPVAAGPWAANNAAANEIPAMPVITPQSPGGNVAASFAAPAETSGLGWPAKGAGVRQASTGFDVPPPGMNTPPPGSQSPGPPSFGPDRAEQQPGRPAGEIGLGAPGPDRFSSIERRLRQYGATYYLLEAWGSEGQLYRFHCKMAMANNPSYTRHFEATDSDALRAMDHVVEQIEAWRAGRLQ